MTDKQKALELILQEINVAECFGDQEAVEELKKQRDKILEQDDDRC